MLRETYFESKEHIKQFLKSSSDSERKEMKASLALKKERSSIFEQIDLYGTKFELSSETKAFGFRIADQCLVRGLIPLRNLKAFAFACLMIASKFNDVEYIDLLFVCSFAREDRKIKLKVTQFEFKILNKIGYDLSWPSPASFAYLFLKLTKMATESNLDKALKLGLLVVKMNKTASYSEFTLGLSIAVNILGDNTKLAEYLKGREETVSFINSYIKGNQNKPKNKEIVV